MSCLDAKTSLVPNNKLIVPSTLLAHATDILTHKATKPRGHSKKKKKDIYIYVSYYLRLYFCNLGHGSLEESFVVKRYRARCTRG